MSKIQHNNHDIFYSSIKWIKKTTDMRTCCDVITYRVFKNKYSYILSVVIGSSVLSKLGIEKNGLVEVFYTSDPYLYKIKKSQNNGKNDYKLTGKKNHSELKFTLPDNYKSDEVDLKRRMLNPHYTDDNGLIINLVDFKKR